MVFFDNALGQDRLGFFRGCLAKPPLSDKNSSLNFQKRRLLQNPVAVFLDESKRISRVRSIRPLAPDNARLSDEARASTDKMHFDHGINFQHHRAAAQKPTATDIFRSAYLLKWFFADVGSPQSQWNSQANAHLTSPLGPNGVQNVRQTRSQGVKINRLLKVRRGPKLFAERLG